MKFNTWSKRRIMLGAKCLTSRKKPNPAASGVKWVSPPLPWWFIKRFLYRAEGAASPAELQSVMNQVQRCEVGRDELFHVHFFHGDEALGLYADDKAEELARYRENRRREF